MSKTLIAFCLFLNPCFGQDYSSLVNNQEIEEIINFDFSNSKKRKQERSGKRRLNYEILMWDTTIFIKPEKDAESLDEFMYLFKRKNHMDTLFSAEDKTFLLEQCRAQKDTLWNSNFKNVKIERTSRINQYYYSMPIFSKNRKVALVRKMFYCGNLCAYGGILVLVKEEIGTWRLLKTVNGWIS